MKPEKQNLAKDLYLNTDKTQQEIADILDVNRRTIYLWIKNGKWEEMKIAARQAPGLILQDIYNHITEINDAVYKRDPGDRSPTMQEVEKLRKLIGMTGVIQKRHTGAYMQAFAELVFYVGKKDRELSQTILMHANNYITGNIGSKNFHLNKERDENIRDVINNLEKDHANAIPIPPDDTAGESAPLAPEPASDEVEQDINGTFCDNNETFSDPSKFPETASGIASGHEMQHEKYLTENIFGDGISGYDIEEIDELPLQVRRSPFRDGNIIWVNHMDDLKSPLDNYGNPWGKVHMADSIRLYPNIC